MSKHIRTNMTPPTAVLPLYTHTHAPYKVFPKHQASTMLPTSSTRPEHLLKVVVKVPARHQEIIIWLILCHGLRCYGQYSRASQTFLSCKVCSCSSSLERPDNRFLLPCQASSKAPPRQTSLSRLLPPSLLHVRSALCYFYVSRCLSF